MIEQIIEPGAVLGVLGGGQLGAMFADAAHRMGYRMAVWDPDPDAPAHRLADHSFVAQFSDRATREQFVNIVHAVTLEWENIPADLCEWLEQRRRTRPSSAVLRVIQDRIRQKQFLETHNIPVPPFAMIDASSQLRAAVDHLGLPAVCKTATAGYDGKGQWVLRDATDLVSIQRVIETANTGQRWILEQFIEFERELSVLVVRDDADDCRVYPVVENQHEGGILRKTLVPAPISMDVAERAIALSLQAVRALQGVGVFCVELFLTESGSLFVNEIAPRPHNSGHYTLDVCSVSQFEQQVRVISGMTLGEVRLLSPAAMVNLIGDDVRSVIAGDGCSDLHSIPGARVHLYGKRVVRPGRKMGHVTFTADRAEVASECADHFMTRIQQRA